MPSVPRLGLRLGVGFDVGLALTRCRFSLHCPMKGWRRCEIRAMGDSMQGSHNVLFRCEYDPWALGFQFKRTSGATGAFALCRHCVILA